MFYHSITIYKLYM
jgi:hypothetical protein